MASFEERLDMLENVLTHVSQAQEQGQARLEQAFNRVEGLIPEAGEAVAGAMKASADQAAEAHLAALLRVVDEVASASRGTVAEASKAIQEIRHSLQAEVQASQGVLKAVNAEAEKASTLLQRMGEQGTHGAETLKAVQTELGSLRENVAGHRVQLNEAIKQAESDARKGLGELQERIRELIPGYWLWLREGFNLAVVILAITGAAWGAYFAAKAYVEKNKGDEIRAEIVQKMVPVGRVYTARQTTTSSGGTSVELRWHDLGTPIMEVGKGVYEAMQPDGKGGWASPRYPGWSWQNLGTATVYRDKTLGRQLDE